MGKIAADIRPACPSVDRSVDLAATAVKCVDSDQNGIAGRIVRVHKEFINPAEDGQAAIVPQNSIVASHPNLAGGSEFSARRGVTSAVAWNDRDRIHLVAAGVESAHADRADCGPTVARGDRFKYVSRAKQQVVAIAWIERIGRIEIGIAGNAGALTQPGSSRAAAIGAR